MSDALLRALKALRDVDGVVGSFVWCVPGVVAGRDLPEYVDTRVLAEVGPRIERIYGAFEDAGDELDSAMLVFAEHKLHVRRAASAFIAVLSTASINMPALKMALSLVSRRVAEAIASAPEPPTVQVPQDPVSTTPTGPEPPAPADPSRVRYYRGNRV